MKLIDVLNDASPLKGRTLGELRQQLAIIREAKFWYQPYFSIDREIQRRTVAEWVHEDVFGPGYTYKEQN